MLQDELTPLTAVESIFLTALGSLGCIILLISLFYSLSNKGIWTGLIMIFFCALGFDRQSANAEWATKIFTSEQKTELIGEVFELEIDIDLQSIGESDGYPFTTGPIRFDKIRRAPKNLFGSYKTIKPITTPFGITLSRLDPDPYDTIWFKVGEQLVKSEVRTVGFNLDEKCSGKQCGLRTGDRVRISVNTDLIEKRPHNSKLEDYYPQILRIERCDDEIPAALPR